MNEDENEKREFLEAIRIGERQAAEGKVITLEQLEQNLKEWLAQMRNPKDSE